MSKDEIFEKLKNILVSVFEIEADDITPDALLGDDLDLDSIDAIDLVVKMKEYTPEGKPAIDASILCLATNFCLIPSPKIPENLQSS